MKLFLSISVFFFSLFCLAQPVSSKAFELMDAIAVQQQLTENSLVKNIPFKNIGPSVMSGRVVALQVNPDDPTEFYVAYASGGVWHTQDNGISFTSIMDHAPTQNIGELAMHWPTRTLWVGTGENNASRSSYAGIGLLKTEDNGATWEQMGLEDAHHVGKILINPTDANHLVVGVTGHLYSPNTERGVYLTKDGGKTWQQTLFVNDTTGIIDMASVPEDFNTLFATAWEKDRKAWNFTGNGAASGIYKSTNGGQSWELLTTADSGFPTGEGVGRIGVSVYDANTIYAIHDNQARRPEEEKDADESLVKDDFKIMTREQFLELDEEELKTFLKESSFPKEYTAEKVKDKVREESIQPKDVALYLEDANSLLFDTPVIGPEVYKSTDGGTTWAKTHEGYLDNVYYSYGYYFGHIHVAPYDNNKMYIYGVPILSSDDGGKTFYNIGRSQVQDSYYSVVHADHHALWINPNRKGHLIDGNDGGVNITYDDGKHWMKNNSTPVGQFYAINVDYEELYHVYGGLQDNGVWKAPHTTTDHTGWHATGHNDWEEIMGGDGMQVQIDNRNSDIVYTGYQFGNYFRLDLFEDSYTRIQPKHELGERPLRFNWQTPILLSSHNQDILYLGSNKLHRSLNQGDDWKVISKDLTKGGKKGNVSYGTLTTISESPFQFGLIYVGTDDGLVQKTTDGGGSWTTVSNSFPQDLWVSRVETSAHKKERVYATLNGYRWDHFKPYVYKSEDGGENWTAIASNLPNSPVNVIREDPENENLLYVGTDMGVYVSFNGGEQWEPFAEGLTAAAVHDLVVQSEAKHLVVGTHGRSIYLADIQYLQQTTEELMDKELYVFETNAVKHSERWGQQRNPWVSKNTPKTEWTVYSATAGNCSIEIHNAEKKTVAAFSQELDKGFNLVPYNLKQNRRLSATKKRKKKAATPPAESEEKYLSKGTYTLHFTMGEATFTRKWEVE